MQPCILNLSVFLAIYKNNDVEIMIKLQFSSNMRPRVDVAFQVLIIKAKIYTQRLSVFSLNSWYSKLEPLKSFSVFIVNRLKKIDSVFLLISKV